MKFISYQNFINDVILWSSEIHQGFDAIVPIPRSGYLPASILALHMNKPLLTMEELKNSVNKYPRSKKVIGEIKTILVVDDSINTGNTIQRFKEHHADELENYNVVFGAVYGLNDVHEGVITFAKVDKPRVFEWNFIHHEHTKKMVFDLDGVICTDPVVDDDGALYRKEITFARPLYKPSRKVLAIVTCRLEKYRKITEEWLAKNGVKYKYLFMMDYETKSERMKAGNHAEYKAEIYQSLINSEGARLFVESEGWQAQKIHTITGQPVICIN